MKIVAIIQARMGSTRLPRKVLKEVMGKTLLEYQLERVRRSKFIDEIVIATTTKKADDEIVSLCGKLAVNVYRGSEQDVLSRYYEAAVEYKADIVVRLTSDCPLIDPDVIDRVIKLYLDNKTKIDYASNTLERTYPRGLDTEVFSFDALKKTYQEATLSRDREHVTSYIYTSPRLFRCDGVVSKHDYKNYRLTVDTIEDFALIKLLFESLYTFNKCFTTADVIKKVNENPTWFKLNEHIEQNKI